MITYSLQVRHSQTGIGSSLGICHSSPEQSPQLPLPSCWLSQTSCPHQPWESQLCRSKSEINTVATNLSLWEGLWSHHSTEPLQGWHDLSSGCIYLWVWHQSGREKHSQPKPPPQESTGLPVLRSRWPTCVPVKELRLRGLTLLLEPRPSATRERSLA